MKYLVRVLMVACWIVGIVLAKGFWSTFFAVMFAPWGWYLIAERLLAAHL